MSVYEMLIAIIIGLIGAVPLVKLANKVGFNVGGGSLALLVLIPILQLPFLYYIAFKNKKTEAVDNAIYTDKKKNEEAWKG